MQKHIEQHLKFQIDVNSASGSSANGRTPSTSEAREPPPQQQQTMPPPNTDWTNQFNSPEAEDMGPFVEQLLPFVRASAYNWFHLQAAKRRYIKDYDKKMSSVEENRKLAELQLELQNDRDDLKVKWASRLLGKLKKDIQNDHKDAFVAAITGVEPEKCIISVADQKGKMRRIDCLRQADKVWRLDLVTIILFKGIPLESTDGERLERSESCIDPLCINPFHMSISVRGLDIFMANYLKDVETKITIAYGPKDGESSSEMGRYIKEEPSEQSIAAPHAVLGTSSSHSRVWEAPTIPSEDTLILSYDPQKACHTYFGGRTSLLQQSAPNPYSYVSNRNAVDNNYYDAKRSVLCLPPPPPQSCFAYTEASSSDSQPLEMSEDSNDGPSEKRSRDLSSHDSPNSSFCSTNDEVRRIVENGTKLGLTQNNPLWAPPGHYIRPQPIHLIPATSRQVRQITDFRNQEHMRATAFRTTKPVRRMTVNAGNHGDVGVVVVDERHHPEPSIHAQTLVHALNSLCTTPTSMRDSPVGRKRVHPSSASPFDFLNCGPDSMKNMGSSGSEVSPPHAAVMNLISRESGGFIASPTKFTTARGDTTSFSKIFQKIEERHSQQHNQPSTSYCDDHLRAPNAAAKPIDASVKLIAPIAIKPTMMPMSGGSSLISSPIVTPRVTPFQGDETLLKVLGLAPNSNDGSFMADLAKLIDSNSRSPLLSGAPTTFSSFSVGGNQPGPSGSDNSAINGSNNMGGAMSLLVPPGLSLAVSQTPTTMTPIHQMPLGNGGHPSASPGSSNEGAANQAPITNAPKDPNAPKMPIDFSEAMLDEKK